ncbi:SagB family peptide dehydrogenase [Streptosporangium amethystogenes]|uniref:SagB family peptide dehydrogenase n=1 Tax=Streptosporangium amethystogenes TaxID=2002 RepID=UPI0004C97C53|nr:SagB family peptide dehydrogenase [Streptosporangium amethystogenes]
MSDSARPAARWGDGYLGFCRGLATVEAEEGLLIDGGVRRYLFSGTSAGSFLPRLLRALDGERTFDELREHLSLPAARLNAALRLLDDRGLLEIHRRPRSSGSACADPQVVAYFSRTFSTMRERFASSTDMLDVLAEAGVLVVGDLTIGEALSRDLRGSGVGRVEFLDAAEELPGLLADHAPDLVLVDDSAGGSGLVIGQEACAKEDIPLLRFAQREATAEIGPLFHRGVTTCVACFRAADPIDETVPVKAPRTLDGVAVGMICTEVISILGGMAVGRSQKGMSRLSLRDHREERLYVVPEAGCVNCGDLTPPAVYEWQEEILPRRIAGSRSTSPEAQARYEKSQGARAEFPYSPTWALPRWPDCPAPGGSASDDPSPMRTPAGPGLDPAVVSAILARVAGFRHQDGGEEGRSFDRWVPSAGNLASAEIYVLCPGGALDLPGNLFRYRDTTHSLIRVRNDETDVRRMLEGVDLQLSEEPEAVLFLVGAVGRLKEKYGAFAYRLALLDAGCAAMQLAMVAGAFGLAARFASAWPEDLGTRLELLDGDEFVTAVAALGGVDQGGRPWH